MENHNTVWDAIRHPRGPLTRAVKRAGLTATGTYAAYVAHGIRHPLLLRSSATLEERGQPLPGDPLVPRPDWVTDFAITIAAAPRQVWPWIVQLGYGRAGWYTWFPLDNGGVPSAEGIVPALQELVVGDVIPDGPRAAEGFGRWRVQALEPDRALVLFSRRNPFSGREIAPGEAEPELFMEMSWVFALVESSPGQTRLQVRVRMRSSVKSWVARAARLFFGLGDNAMENTMLAGIKERAERHRLSAP
jgi:proline iminopeptidase